MTLSLEPERPPIRARPDGTLLVGDTRVPIDTVLHFHESGAPPEEIVRRFDTLELADVYGAIAWYLRHKDDVDAYLLERERQAEDIRREWERLHPPEELRKRLIERRVAR